MQNSRIRKIGEAFSYIYNLPTMTKRFVNMSYLLNNGCVVN